MKKFTVLLSLLAAIALAACTTDVEDQTEQLELKVEWEVYQGEPGTHTERFTLINQGEEPLNGDWKIYYNRITAYETEDFEPAGVRVRHISGYFYTLEPTGNFKPLLPGDTAVFEHKLRGPVARFSFVPEGMYVVIGEGDPVEVEEPYVTYYKDGLPPSLQGITSVERYEQNAMLSMLPADQLQPVVPGPMSLKLEKDTFWLEDARIGYAPELLNEAEHLGRRLSQFLDGTIQLAPSDSNAVLRLEIDRSVQGLEAYLLQVNSEGIRITAGTEKGLFYGIQTLSALISPLKEHSERVGIPYVSVRDEPRFAYRGLHVDMGRNFKSVESLKKIIDLMAFYKLNVLNLQLSDDEGWRLEIPSLPELTEIGGRRGHTLDESDRLYPAYGSGPFMESEVKGGTGWYSRQEFLEILRYANSRHIEVIPKIDFPGHARAAIIAMQRRYERLKEEGASEEFASNHLLTDPDDRSEYLSVQGYNDNVICVCRESVYHFLETVVDDILAMYAEVEVPVRMIHLGGDEVPDGVWERSPVCNDLVEDTDLEMDKNQLASYFVGRVNDILARRDLITSGWEEFASLETEEGLVPNPEFVDNQIIPYVWHKEYAYPLANAGYKVIICNSNSLYFDLAYEQDVFEPGLTWAGYVSHKEAFELDPYRLDVEDKIERPENIMGIQAQLWGETVWTEERMEYYLFPKLIGLAERAWSKEPAWAAMAGENREEEFGKHWNRFVNTLTQREFSRLHVLGDGLVIRLPRPGAKIENGMLYANTSLPGIEIRFTTDGTEPHYSSRLYTEPVSVSGEVRLRSFSGDNRSFTTIIN